MTTCSFGILTIIMRRLSYFLFPIGFLLFLNSCAVKKKATVLNGNKGAIEQKTSGSRANVRQHYAALLNTSPKELNESLYEFIDDWMGSPHRMGGQTKDGVDCSGFVGMIYKQIYSKNLPRTSRDMAEVVKRKYDNELKEGDLVFFSFGGKSIDHVGIYLHNDKFVHVSTKQGVVISNLKDTWYYKYLTRCGTPQI